MYGFIDISVTNPLESSYLLPKLFQYPSITFLCCRFSAVVYVVDVIFSVIPEPILEESEEKVPI